MANITAVIKSVLGDVTVIRANGAMVKLNDGDVISVGDIITTGPNGTATIEFPQKNGQKLTEGTLRNDSRILITSENNSTVIEVQDGFFDRLSDDQSLIKTTDAKPSKLFGFFETNDLIAVTAAVGPLAVFTAVVAADVLDEKGSTDTPSNQSSGMVTGLEGAPAPVATVADSFGPLNGTILAGYDALLDTPLAPLETTIESLSGITIGLEPVTDQIAELSAPLSPLLTPLDSILVGGIQSASPITNSINSFLSESVDLLGVSLSPITDLTSSVPATAISDQIGDAVNSLAPSFVNGITEITSSLQPLIAPLQDNLNQLAVNGEFLTDSLTQGAERLPVFTSIISEIVVDPVLNALQEGGSFLTASQQTSEALSLINANLSGGGSASVPISSTDSLFDQVLPQNLTGSTFI